MTRTITRPLEAFRDELGPLSWRLPYVALVDDVLTPAECDAHIARIEASAPSLASINAGGGRMVERPDVRNNDRVIFDDRALAAELYARLAEAVPPLVDEARAVGLNERFRAYRYRPGQRFAPHFDGAFVRDAHERSEITVLVYLNDDFAGGETAFLDYEYAVRPRRGMALLFAHPVLHEGCVVTSGAKYALRTDVMYRRA